MSAFSVNEAVYKAIIWSQHPLGQLHVSFALTALVCGPLIFFSTKGTRAHRVIGWVYVAAMAILNLTALASYQLTGRFNFFHFAALASLATLAPATWFAVVARRSGNRSAMITHGILMSWSYFGLVAAFLSEIFTRALPFMLHGEGGWLRFGTALAIYLSIAGWWSARIIHRRVPAIIMG